MPCLMCKTQDGKIDAAELQAFVEQKAKDMLKAKR